MLHKYIDSAPENNPTNNHKKDMGNNLNKYAFLNNLFTTNKYFH